MRLVWFAGSCLALSLAAACQPGAEAPPPAAGAAKEAPSYAVVPVSAEDEPGAARRVRCQVGDRPEQECTFTPLFGDESFQLDGADIALRMVVTGNEGGLFEVFGPEHRVPVSGAYRRSSGSDPCWVVEGDGPGPSPICVR